MVAGYSESYENRELASRTSCQLSKGALDLRFGSYNVRCVGLPASAQSPPTQTIAEKPFSEIEAFSIQNECGSLSGLQFSASYPSAMSVRGFDAIPLGRMTRITTALAAGRVSTVVDREIGACLSGVPCS